MFYVCMIKNNKVVLDEEFIEPFKDYKEDVQERINNLSKLRPFDYVINESVLDGAGVYKNDLGNLMRSLRHYDEVGISNDIYDFLFDNKQVDFDYVVLGSEEPHGFIDFSKYSI